jgi:hypothetical protein
MQRSIFKKPPYFCNLILSTGKVTSIERAMESENFIPNNPKSFSTNELFQKLETLNASLDAQSFQSLSDQFESPEELTAHLTKQLQIDEKTALYRIVFELWKRLCPEKKSLSIFCDEFNEMITHYKKGQRENENADLVAFLQYILEENLDSGIKPKMAFQNIQSYFQHDLEGFLYRYILDQINEGHAGYASELLDGFYNYLSKTSWFDYLKIRKAILDNPEEGFSHLGAFITQQKKRGDLSLLLEIYNYVAHSAHHGLFNTNLSSVLHLIETESDFLKALQLTIIYYEHIDKNRALNLSSLLAKRDTPHAFSKEDPDFQFLKSMTQKPVLN